MINQDIITYYQSSHLLYELFCYDKNSLGMHFGFWDKTTKNRYDAIQNENQEIIRVGQIQKGMKVLDAGCGVGGSAFYIAKNTGAKVWGITIDPQQVKSAQKYAIEKQLQHLVEFSTQDYTNTHFPNNYFDVVYGIESVCYTKPKTTFLKEAYRVLKPGGILVIADGYVSRKPKTEEEKKIISDFNWAFALSEMITSQEMLRQIKSSQFKLIYTENMIEKVIPSIYYFTQLGFVTAPICWLAQFIHFSFFQAIYKNFVALDRIGKAHKIALWAYYIHCAQKPKK
jgi:tocopherol O-methyltransferase